jgi:hypothetical protein
MATLTKFQSFVEALAEKKHNLGSDTLTVALCAAANAPNVSTHSVLADLTQISYTNLSSRVLTVSSSAQTSGTYKLVLADLVLTASGGAVAPFRYIVVFNDTATNDELIGYLDYGSDLTLADGDTLTLDFSATNGILQLV